MKKTLKMLIGGAILGSLGYLFLSENGRDRRLRMADKASDAGAVIALGNDILRMETPEGVTKGEHVGLITTLFKELASMQTPEEIEKTRFRLSILADVDAKWRPFSEIFNKGAWTVMDREPAAITANDEELP